MARAPRLNRVQRRLHIYLYLDVKHNQRVLAVNPAAKPSYRRRHVSRKLAASWYLPRYPHDVTPTNMLQNSLTSALVRQFGSS